MLRLAPGSAMHRGVAVIVFIFRHFGVNGVQSGSQGLLSLIAVISRWDTAHCIALTAYTLVSAVTGSHMLCESR